MEHQRQHSCSPRPFLKWAGGKRALAPEIGAVVGSRHGRYFEPFVGAGAIVFSGPQASGYVIGDLNSELVNTYRAIRENPHAVANALESLEQSEDNYYRVRAWDREASFPGGRTSEELAARMIYLNRLCFNGLYRVNSRNQFNVPYGQRVFSVAREVRNLMEVSRFLNGECCDLSAPVQIRQGSYRDTSSDARAGDLVYFDPPYAPISSDSFVGYQPDGFSSQQQIELRDFALELSGQGARCVISNSNAEQIWDLYGSRSDFHIREVLAPRRVGANASSRTSITELLIQTVDRQRTAFE